MSKSAEGRPPARCDVNSSASHSPSESLIHGMASSTLALEVQPIEQALMSYIHTAAHTYASCTNTRHTPDESSCTSCKHQPVTCENMRLPLVASNITRPCCPTANGRRHTQLNYQAPSTKHKRRGGYVSVLCVVVLYLCCLSCMCNFSKLHVKLHL